MQDFDLEPRFTEIDDHEVEAASSFGCGETNDSYCSC